MILPEYNEEDINQIEDTAFELSKKNTVFYSGHCTGEVAFERMKNIMGNKLRAISEL